MKMPTLSNQERAFYGHETTLLKKTDTETIYQIDCDTSDGTMQTYHLFEGVDLAYFSFNATSCFARERSFKNILEISYCSKGRYEAEYKRNFFTYQGDGDIAITVLSPHADKPTFPIGIYEGVALIVDMDVANNKLSSVIDGVTINMRDLVTKFCAGNCCSVMKATPELEHVFEEICCASNKSKIGYLRIKTLEILFLLSEILPQENLSIAAYYPKTTIDKIKKLKSDLTTSLEAKITLEMWAEKYDLNLTTMKECFKAIYGKPIYSFQKEYRIQFAANLLLSTNLSITEIAGNIGYTNPNKFSTVFKEIIGLSPREYRSQKK